MIHETFEIRTQKHQFWIILCIVFVGFIGISIPYLIFPPLFLNTNSLFLPSDWDASSRVLILGVTLAAYPFGQFIGSPILGSLSDDYGRKPLLLGSLVIACISSFLAGIAILGQHVIGLVLARFIAGLMEGNIAIARAMCAELKKLPKQTTFGRLNAAISIAYLMGPFLGGLMTDSSLFQGFSTATPFFFIGILFLSLAGVAGSMVKNNLISNSVPKRTLWERLNFVKRASRLFINPRLKLLMIACTSFTLAVDMFYEFGPVYLTLKWDLSSVQLILYNGVLCLGLAIGNGWISGRIGAFLSNRSVVLSGMGVFSTLITAIILTDTHLFMAGWFGLIGIGIGLVVTLLTVKISDSVSDEIQGEVMGTQLSLRVLGDGIICLVGAVLFVISPKIILAVAAFLSLATLVYYKKFCNLYGI